MEITCPSGLRGTLRKLKVKEQGNLLRQVGGGQGKASDQRIARLDKLLEVCWDSTQDPGIYRWDNGRPVWPEVLSGDRLYSILKVREKTFGSKYEFPVRCGNRPTCNAQFRWTVDLNDLPVQPLPDASKAMLLAKEPFVVDLDGTPIHFHLPTGKDEARRADPTLDPITGAVLRRVDKVGDVSDRKELIGLIEDMDADDLDYLLAEMEAMDCGVDTEFEVQCPYCDALTSVDLPFDRTFWMPRTAGRRLRTL